MKTLRPTLLSAGALALSLALATLPMQAEAGPYRGWHGGYWRGGHWWGPGLVVGAVGLGVGLGLANAYAEAPVYVPAPVYYPAPGVSEQPAPAARQAPEPIVYPKNGQSAEQTESDRQDCNRWATSQPSAMADASVFNRATQACLEGRGYTVR